MGGGVVVEGGKMAVTMVNVCCDVGDGGYDDRARRGKWPLSGDE